MVDGSTAPLANGKANWSLNVTKPSTATVTIKDSTGQTAYTGTFSVNPGTQNFAWDGRGNDGKLWPDGNYTMTATGVDANGQSVGISTEVQAPVDSVDLTQNPPLLSINGQNYTMDKIKRSSRPAYASRHAGRLRSRGLRAPPRPPPFNACSIARSSADNSNGLRRISKRPSAACAASEKPLVSSTGISGNAPGRFAPARGR